MSIELTDDLQKIVDQKVTSGEYESVIAVVAEALKALQERDASMESLRRSLAELKAGDTLPAEEVFEGIRRKHGWNS